MTEIVTPVLNFDARVLPEPFVPSREERAEIDAAWADVLSKTPEAFDGPILLARDVSFEDGVVRIAYVRTSYATLVWRRSLGFPESGLGNAFGAAVVISSDGATLLGRMGRATVNAGQLYFPCGTPDPTDIVDGRVDLEGSIVRELAEETGLAAPLVRPSERRIVVATGGLVACLRRFDTELDAEALAAAARAHLASEADPELGGVEIAFSADELTAASPHYVRAALLHLLGAAKR